MIPATAPRPEDAARYVRRSSLSPLLKEALTSLPVDDMLPAARMTVLAEMGFGDMEIGRQLGMSWRALEAMRERLRGRLVAVMSGDYSEGEIVRTLGIGTARVRELGDAA